MKIENKIKSLVMIPLFILLLLLALLLYSDSKQRIVEVSRYRKSGLEYTIIFDTKTQREYLVVHSTQGLAVTLMARWNDK